MTKIVIFILACTTCDLTKITYPFNNDKYVFCGDMANDIRTNMATYKEEVNGDKTLQGWYTKEGYLFIGARCE
jgi:hypothetical protein|tara:strand:+ start:196 stop:414 length:219 start_codon:yes stop_codon:yes gene_type:complete